MPHHEHIGMEPTAGIEPAHSAWKADVLPLNYVGKRGRPHGKEKKANVILRRYDKLERSVMQTEKITKEKGCVMMRYTRCC